MNDKRKVLIVEDDLMNAMMLENLLLKLGHEPSQAGNGRDALKKLETYLPDIIILDIVMPIMNGYEFLREIKKYENLKDIPVIITSSVGEIESISKCIGLGATGYFVKPINHLMLANKIDLCLSKKMFLEKEIHLNSYLKNLKAKINESSTELSSELLQAHTDTIFAMAKLLESRDVESGDHLFRVSEYCRILLKQLQLTEKYKDIVTDDFINKVTVAAPLHDIGKVGISDNILLKPDKLTPEEYKMMQEHISIGSASLEAINAKSPKNGFITVAIEIAKYHHEKWDGTGYNLKLKGEEIPLSARVMALSDVYDALSTRRCYKLPYSHEKSREAIIDASGSQFDPDIIEAFTKCEDKFIEVLNSHKIATNGEPQSPEA